MIDIKESDWKLFRRLHPIALSRFCERVLKDAEAIISKSKNVNHLTSPHPVNYLELYKLVSERDKDLGRLFNDYRRSTALSQLRLICSMSLLTADEIAQFSPEAQRRMTL